MVNLQSEAAQVVPRLTLPVTILAILCSPLRNPRWAFIARFPIGLKSTWDLLFASNAPCLSIASSISSHTRFAIFAPSGASAAKPRSPPLGPGGIGNIRTPYRPRYFATSWFMILTSLADGIIESPIIFPNFSSLYPS